MNASAEASSTETADPLRQLMARVALRDRGAFERLYRATSAHLFSISLRVLRDEGRADEVLQEAYVSIWQKAASYQPDAATPMTWMINIVRNRAIDALRAGRNERDSTVELNDEAMDVPADASGDPHALLDESLTKARIDQCMLALPPAQRQALALAYYRGMVHTEIAEMLRSPLGTVKSWVRRGLDQLKSCLDGVAVRT
ncbi:sigma-70 family RNA polymerase sigma factor [Roseateles chitinivorans]|uniref:sigma-70 family RNA polymerase sigma factor n=1 Tax=Roseateles chitinivorans TaxID=2917965 RepID=UPI003D672076